MEIPYEATAFCDGGCKPNPGWGAFGVSFCDMYGREFAHTYGLIENATVNVAEYTAVLEAIELALHLGLERLHIRTDSMLVARQLQGRYKFTNTRLLHLAQAIHKTGQDLEWEIDWVSRRKNARADALTRLALSLGAVQQQYHLPPGFQAPRPRRAAQKPDREAPAASARPRPRSAAQSPANDRQPSPRS